MHQFVFLKHFGSIVEAKLTKNLLAQHQIQSVARNSGIKFPGDMGDLYGADLFVMGTQVTEAKNVLGIMSDKR